ncbi:MAG TPA: SpoIIE family protein phosphatase [Acidimicrobiales bacterium]
MDQPPRTTAGAAPPSTPRRWPILSPRVGYAFAFLLPAAVTLMVSGLDNPSYRIGSAFFASIAIVAALGGAGPAIVGGVTSTLGFWYASLTPTRSFRLEVPEGVVSLAVFLVSTGTILWIAWQRDQAAEHKAAHERRYRRLADTGLIGVIFWHIDGHITDANDAFLAMLGYSREDLGEGRLDWRQLTPAKYVETDDEKVAELAANGYHEPFEKEYLGKDGHPVPVLVGSAFLEGSDSEGVSYVLDLSERVRLEAERESLLVSERAARRDAEVANRRLELVASASVSLMAVIEPDEVIERLAGALVPELGEVVSVFVPEGDLLHRALTVHHTHPELGEVLTRRYPVIPTSDSPVAEAFRTGHMLPVPAVDTARSAALASAEYTAVVAAMRLSEGLAIPLRNGGEVIGVLALMGTDDRPLEPGAGLVAQTIAERAAVALQKAHSFAAERQVAATMQRALLPDSDRTIAGHDVGTCYVPAAEGREVGGDWWDIVPLVDGRVALVVGDVSGHGVHLAPSMAKMRHSISGVLTHGASPAEAATAASHLLRVSRPGAYATAFVAVYDPATRDLVYSRAGHPPALVLVDDQVLELDHPGGTLLGLDVAQRQETTIRLPEGFELIAFTDGLVETPGLTYDEGVSQLIAAARALPDDIFGQERAESLVASVVGTAGTDDVCVVMVRPCTPSGTG